MVGTSAVRNLIREGKIPQLYSMIQMGSKLGMSSMKDSINNLLNQKIITEETARNSMATSTSEDNADAQNTTTANTAPVKTTRNSF
mgnify:CR=1 FL=1